MNEASFQLYRAKFILWYDSTLIVAARLLVFFIGLAAVCLLLLSFVLSLSQNVMALALVLLGPSLLIGAFHLYVNFIKENSAFLLTAKLRQNPLNNCDLEAVLLVDKMLKSVSFSDFWQALFSNKEVATIFYRLNLSPKVLASMPLVKETVKEDFVEALTNYVQNNPQKLLTVFDVVGFIVGSASFNELLKRLNVDLSEVNVLLSFYQERNRFVNEYRQGKFSGKRIRTGGFAKSWSVAYTNVLDLFTQEINVSLARSFQLTPLFNRQQYVLDIVRELNKSSSQNVLLIGPSGIGKKEIFYHFAASVLLYQTNTTLDGSQVRLLDVQRLLSTAGTPGELEALFSQIFTDLHRAGNVILFIDNIELLLDPGGQIGTINAGVLLSSYLDSGKIRFVATVSSEGYLKLIKSNRALAARFVSLEIPEPSGEELMKILLFHLPRFEDRYKVFFLFTALKTLIKLTARYIKDQASPSREFSLMEEIAATAQSESKVLVTQDEVTAVVERKVKVPIKVDQHEQKALINLEKALHQRIVGQDRAIKKISDALLRSRAGLEIGNKPVGSFLFLGPTGVGKTETAKALAEIYYGGLERMARLDMTEFADSNGLIKLLGSDPINQPGALTISIQQNPSTVVLFDEIEKASEEVRNLFLQLLDEGRLTTNYGKVLDFTNAIVIATSNAGSQYIKSMVERSVAVGQFEKQLIDQLISDKIFLPEFLNRFDAIVVYLPLSPAEVEKIVTLQINGLVERVKREKGVELVVSEAVVKELARQGYDPVFGARALARAIKDKLETYIAKRLLEETPDSGSRLLIESLA